MVVNHQKNSGKKSLGTVKATDVKSVRCPRQKRDVLNLGHGESLTVLTLLLE